MSVDVRYVAKIAQARYGKSSVAARGSTLWKDHIVRPKVPTKPATSQKDNSLRSLTYR